MSNSSSAKKTSWVFNKKWPITHFNSGLKNKDIPTTPNIPIIDLIYGEDNVEQIKYACETYGFFIISNQNYISREEMESVFKHSKNSLFNNETDKDILKPNREIGEIRGYFEMGVENIDGLTSTVVDGNGGYNDTNQIDAKEGWEMGDPNYFIQNRENPIDLAFSGEHNKFPCAKFKKIMTRYYRNCIQLCRHLLYLIGMALELPDPNFFVKHCDNPISTLRLLRYFPSISGINSIGIGAHRDYGLLTLLLTDGQGGLQILHENKWLNVVTPDKYHYVVNIGDMLQRWTNGRFLSNIHRVIHLNKAKSRFSVPFFFEPNLRTIIDPILKSEEHEKLYDTDTCENILTVYYRKSGLLY